jgi:hypothetical protein
MTTAHRHAKPLTEQNINRLHIAPTEGIEKRFNGRNSIGHG